MSSEHNFIPKADYQSLDFDALKEPSWWIPVPSIAHDFTVQDYLALALEKVQYAHEAIDFGETGDAEYFRRSRELAANVINATHLLLAALNHREIETTSAGRLELGVCA